MQERVKVKNIVIPYHGPIPTRGGAYGPVTMPYLEDTSAIAAMLCRNIPVEEVLKDGTRVRLELNNYNVDNEPKEVKVEQPVNNIVRENNPKNNNNKNNNQNNNKNQQRNNNQKNNNNKPEVDEIEEI